MGFDPKITVNQFLRDAAKHPDGRAAYAVSAIFFGLVVVGFLAPLLGDLVVLQRLRDHIFPMLIMPVLMLGCYGLLNEFFDVSAGDRWFNVVVILIVGGVFLWITVFR